MTSGAGAGTGLSRRAVVLAGLWSSGPVVWAHRQHVVYSGVVWSVSLGRIAVTHRLEIKDAGVAVLGRRSASFDSVRQRAKCARYVSKRFSVAGQSGPVNLEIVGAEVDGRHVYVYQDAAGSRLRSATVENRIFMDAFPDQVNRVNIDMGTGVRTLIFTRHDGSKSVVLD